MTGATPRAEVIGAGISGLVVAHDLRRAGWAVTIREADDRIGGKIRSSPVGDRLVDAGPDTFLARAPAGRALCEDLGLADELTSPVSPVGAYIARDGDLHPLPPASMLGVPTDLDALTGSSLISPDGIAAARAALDRLTSDTQPDELRTGAAGAGAAAIGSAGDRSVGAVCRAQLGDEITDYLVDPLLGGINASDIDHLGLRAGAPLLASALDRSPSLIDGLRQLRPAAGPTLGTAEGSPVFYGLPGGIARIVERLVEVLTGDGPGPVATIESSRPVAAPLPGTEAVAGPPPDATVVATPAYAAAELVRAVSPDAASGLDGIPYASVAQATVELPVDAVAWELDASGILFPRVEGTLLTASTWFSTKWAHYRRPGTVLIRLTSGRFGDDRPAGLDDGELVEALLADLRTVMAVDGRPTATRVVRWSRALPQYGPGHRDRVEAITAALAADAPSIHLVGAAYEGIGIPACIDHARATARRIIDAHRSEEPAGSDGPGGP